MKRKMASKENIPTKKTTNGGNGGYMRRAVMKDNVSARYGKRTVLDHIAGSATAIPRYRESK